MTKIYNREEKSRDPLQKKFCIYWLLLAFNQMPPPKGSIWDHFLSGEKQTSVLADQFGYF